MVRKLNRYELIFKIVVRKLNRDGLIFKIVMRKRNWYGYISKLGERLRNVPSNKYVISSNVLISTIFLHVTKFDILFSLKFLWMWEKKSNTTPFVTMETWSMWMGWCRKNSPDLLGLPRIHEIILKLWIFFSDWIFQGIGRNDNTSHYLYVSPRLTKFPSSEMPGSSPFQNHSTHKWN